MKKDGFDRAFRYFAIAAEQYVLYASGLGVAMVVYMWVLNGSRSFLDMVSSIPGSILYISAFIMFIFGMTAGQQLYSMLIAMGCRRRNVFLGSLTMNILYISECLILYEVLERILNPEHPPLGIPILLTAYLLLASISKLMCIATIKWGKIANILVFIVIFVLSLALGIWVGYSGGSEVFGWMYDMIGGSFHEPLQWVAAGVAVLICILGNICTWKFLKNYEVRT